MESLLTIPIATPTINGATDREILFEVPPSGHTNREESTGWQTEESMRRYIKDVDELVKELVEEEHKSLKRQMRKRESKEREERPQTIP